MKEFSILQVGHLLPQGKTNRLLFKDYSPNKATELDCPGGHGPTGGEKERQTDRETLKLGS